MDRHERVCDRKVDPAESGRFDANSTLGKAQQVRQTADRQTYMIDADSGEPQETRPQHIEILGIGIEFHVPAGKVMDTPRKRFQTLT